MAVVVQPFVAALRKAALVTSDEVAEAFWVPLTTFTGPDTATESDVPCPTAPTSASRASATGST